MQEEVTTHIAFAAFQAISLRFFADNFSALG